MTLTAIVGALMALVARPERSVDSEIARLTKKNAHLARSHARLVDHIESLERELLTERRLCTHWKAEAMRLAREAREERESVGRAQAHAQADMQAAQAQALAQALQGPAQAAQNAQAWQGLGQAAENAHQNMQHMQALNLYQQNQQIAALGQQSDWQGFCNCVPSRSQVWDEERRRDDAVGQRIAQLRP